MESNFKRFSRRFGIRGCVVWVFIIGIWLPANLYAGGGPENVVLVVNADSASSKMIANYYIHGRNIPARNVIYLNDIPNREVTTISVFREQILKPVFAEIEVRKLAPSIDYIVYSADFPTMINVAGHLVKLKEIVKKKTGREPPSKLFNAMASINSLTYFAGSILADDPGYMMLDSNAYYRQPAQVLLRRPFHGKSQESFENAIKKVDSGSDTELKSSIKALEELAKKNPQQLATAYWLAKIYGKLGDAKNATAWLTRAVRLGWCYRKQTLADLAFEKVQDDPVFKGIVDRIPDQPFDFVPTHGFKQRYAWGPNGLLNNEPGQGQRHILSTVLAVTRNQGITEKQALRQLKLSIAADESNPQGTFYFTDTSDVRTKTRKPNFKAAIENLEQMGFKTEIVTDILPIKARDVVGLTCGKAVFNWTSTGSKIIPGAICENLTSYGGRLNVAGHTKVTEFLAHGAAGSSGTVTEPFALQAKFPHPMIHVHYARGCSLAEAFYQSLHGPFQTIIVGDALCQPWANKPVLKVEGLTAGDTVKGKIELRLDVSQSATPIAGIEFYVDGVLVHRIPLRKAISFDTTNMTDGYHEIRLVAVAKNQIQTTSSVILPIRIDNKGVTTTLTTEHADYLDTDQIRFQAKSNYGDSIELIQNGRSLAKKIGRDVEFKIPASLVGRGPVKLHAVAISESGSEVASMPIELEIEGRISELKENTEPRKKPAPKKPAPK